MVLPEDFENGVQGAIEAARAGLFGPPRPQRRSRELFLKSTGDPERDARYVYTTPYAQLARDAAVFEAERLLAGES